MKLPFTAFARFGPDAAAIDAMSNGVTDVRSVCIASFVKGHRAQDTFCQAGPVRQQQK